MQSVHDAFLELVCVQGFLHDNFEKLEPRDSEEVQALFIRAAKVGDGGHDDDHEYRLFTDFKMSPISDLDLSQLSPLFAYRLDGNEIVNDNVSAERFIAEVEEYCRSSPFPIRKVAIGMTCCAETNEDDAEAEFTGLVAELFIIDPAVVWDDILTRLLADLSVDDAWLTTIGGTLLASHRMGCRGVSDCTGCRAVYVANKANYRNERREGNWDRIVHIDLAKKDFDGIDITDPAAVKTQFHLSDIKIQSRSDLRSCLYDSEERLEDDPEADAMERLIDNTPPEKFVLTLHLFGFDTCPDEDCDCSAGTIRAEYMTYFRGVMCSKVQGKKSLKSSSSLESLTHHCGNCQKKATTTVFLACSKCRSERYCGRDCQVTHWPTHKLVCGRLLVD